MNKIAKKFYKTFKTNIIKPEYFFLAFAAPLGFLLVFLTPPLQAPDEQSHFFQSYSVSNLDFVWDKFEINNKVTYGPELPKSVFDASDQFMSQAGKPNVKITLSQYKQYISQPLNADDTEYRKSGTSYTPLVYLPQAVGINIGKLFDASPIILIWLARIANLVVWLVVIFLAIRLFPVAKWALLALALNPVAVFLSASMSADVMNIALAFLFVSLIFATVKDKEKYISRKRLFVIFLVLVGLALTKPVSIIFGLLLFVLPWKKFKTKLKYILFAFLAIFIAASTTLAWNALVGEGTQASIQLQRPGEGVDPPMQLRNVLTDPVDFIVLLVKNYVIVSPGYYGDAVFNTFFGVFGWLDSSIPVWTIFLYIIGLIIAILYQFGRGASFSAKQKILFFIIFMGFVTANILAMYLVYTPFDRQIIEGVQGRYFIPASILLLGIFTGRNKLLNLSEKKLIIILASIFIVIFTIMLLRLVMRYYIS